LGSPTYARDLLEAVRALLASRRYGVYHVVNTGACTRYDVALQIAEYLESNIRIIPVTSADFQLAAPRPRSEAAISYKLELTGLHKMRHWREALHEYLGTWQQNKVAAG
jgi:dTDP-4-dehydrorhamnose reductase